MLYTPILLPQEISIERALVAAIIQLTGHSDTPRLDAEVLLTHVMGRNRAYFRAWPERVLSLQQSERFSHFVTRCTQGEPVAYVIGEREFWSRSFIVTPHVLIPRPETEELVASALASFPLEKPCTLLELGTGSGIIAVTLAIERPLATISATDHSQEALSIAIQNAIRYEMRHIRFIQANWFAGLPEDMLFDGIISNPPYIAEGDPHLVKGDLRFEPYSALVSGHQGVDALNEIIDTARFWLKPGGQLFLEHGYNQAETVEQRLTYRRYTSVHSFLDRQGHRRVISATWPGGSPLSEDRHFLLQQTKNEP